TAAHSACHSALMIILLLLGFASLAACSDHPPAEDPTQGKWTVFKDDEQLHPCIKMYATIRLKLSYVDADDAMKEVPEFAVPADAIAATGEGKSSCYERVHIGDEFIDSQVLHLEFPHNEGWNVRLAFTQDPRMGVNQNDYALWQVNVTANYSSMPDLFHNAVKDHTHTYFSVIDFLNPPYIAGVEYTALGDSLYCPETPQEFEINVDESVGPFASISLSDLWMQAYMSTDDFGKQVICADDQTDLDMVPVIISAILAGLVLFTLITYFVYRSRLPTDILEMTEPEFEEEHEHHEHATEHNHLHDNHNGSHHGHNNANHHDNYGYKEEENRF
ncbi:hypothetical protein PMAYCL1PPCAC_21489, partial [Pristionchus mayeri]